MDRLISPHLAFLLLFFNSLAAFASSSIGTAVGRKGKVVIWVFWVWSSLKVDGFFHEVPSEFLRNTSTGHWEIPTVVSQYSWLWSLPLSPWLLIVLVSFCWAYLWLLVILLFLSWLYHQLMAACCSYWPFLTAVTGCSVKLLTCWLFQVPSSVC